MFVEDEKKKTEPDNNQQSAAEMFPLNKQYKALSRHPNEEDRIVYFQDCKDKENLLVYGWLGP